MQKHKLLISISGTTAPINSTLKKVNGYQVNVIQGLGGGIVNYSNVRKFLNDDVNLIIINDFYTYLTGATTQVEFREIYNSDQKLSDVFNNYYDSSIVNNQFPPSTAIDNSLAGTTGVTVVDSSAFKYNGVAPSKGLLHIPLSINNTERELKVFSALTTFTYEPSYYVPVFIKRSYSQTDRERVYFENIMKEFNDFVPDLGNDTSGGNDYDYNGGSNSYDAGAVTKDVAFTPPQDFFNGFGDTGEVEFDFGGKQSGSDTGSTGSTGSNGVGDVGEVKFTK
jgi:hypothetical protein